MTPAPRALLSCSIVVFGVVAATWVPQSSGVTARLRGVSAVDDRVVWASGANGTLLRTTDAGERWQGLSIPGTGDLDFRDIDAVSATTAWTLSIGPGDASRIYKTTDAGAHWNQQFINHDPNVFLDAMAFWDAARGVAVSDSIDGRFVILITRDGGSTWTRVPPDRLPPALANEGAFAASGTNVAVLPPDDVWIGTGAAEKARVLHSGDGGSTWTIADTPLASGASSGIFSIAFRDARHGIVVGGDYKQESESGRNVAITSDGGITWTATSGLGGFRSVVAYVPRSGAHPAIAVGPRGADWSDDDGRTWKPIAGDGYHAFAVARGSSRVIGWGVGERGRIGIMHYFGAPPAFDSDR